MILLAPPEILSSINFENDSTEKSNRLCLISEKLNMQKNTSKAIDSLKEAVKIDPNNSTAAYLWEILWNKCSKKQLVLALKILYIT